MSSPTMQRAVNATMEPVLHSLKYSIDFLVEQISDLSDEQMASQAGGAVNHPAWTIGHLSYVLNLIGTVIGLDQSLPDNWSERFGPGSSPMPDAGVDETRDELVRVLLGSRDRLIKAVERLDDATLDQPFPDPEYLDVFPTVRHAMTQVLVGHTAFHVGQISVWRRAMGLPGLQRSYE